MKISSSPTHPRARVQTLRGSLKPPSLKDDSTLDPQPPRIPIRDRKVKIVLCNGPSYITGLNESLSLGLPERLNRHSCYRSTTVDALESLYDRSFEFSRRTIRRKKQVTRPIQRHDETRSGDDICEKMMKTGATMPTRLNMPDLRRKAFDGFNEK